MDVESTMMILSHCQIPVAAFTIRLTRQHRHLLPQKVESEATASKVSTRKFHLIGKVMAKIMVADRQNRLKRPCSGSLPCYSMAISNPHSKFQFLFGFLVVDSHGNKTQRHEPS